MSVELEFAPLSTLQGELLESPVWDAKRGILYCCDIVAGAIHAVNLQGDLLDSWHFGEVVPSFGLCESGRLVVALTRTVVIFDPQTGERTALWEASDEAPTSRLNDGKCGPDGAFWVGSMDGRPQRQPISKLYRITADGQGEIKAGGIEISNGLAWSADGKTMFHSDSRGPWLDRYDFDPASGAMSNRQRLVDLDEATGRPDGGATDADGYYWSAGVSAGCLNRFDRDGTIAERYLTPVSAPTMPCFCGPDLRHLVITTHRQNDGACALSGRLFLAKAPIAGVAVTAMRGL